MKILIVGLGSMGKRRARLIGGLKSNISICGVDNNPLRRKEAETKFGMTTYPSIEAGISAERPDAALVCTAPLAHASIIRQLLEQGLPTFTELNLVNDGYVQNIELAKRKQLPLFLSSTMLYRKETQFIISEVKEFNGKVNWIYHVGQYLPDWHPWESYQDFFVSNPKTGGVREILAVELPWLLQAYGSVSSFQVQKDKLSNLKISYPDNYVIIFQHYTGAKGVLVVDIVSPKSVRNFECYGDGIHLFWEGTPDTLYKYNSSTKERDQIFTYTSDIQDKRYGDNIIENAYVDELINFLGVIDGTQQPKYSFEKDLEVIKIMDDIEK